MAVPTDAQNAQALYDQIAADGLLVYNQYFQSRTPPNLWSAMQTIIGANPPPPPLTTQAIVSNGGSITVKNSAGTTVGTATATVAAHAISGAALPATKAVVTNADSVVILDNGGGTNAKSPAVAAVALGVVTNARLAA